MALRSLLTRALMVTILTLPAIPGRGANLEQLLMPGPVSRAHAKTESQCSACHDRTDRSRQRPLCLACHKDVAADLQAHTGFHGRAPVVARGQCVGCHSEHLGRDADIVHLSRVSFDHALTDFPLRGAHARLACESCHRQGSPWRKAPAACAACHRADDAHHGALGSSCATCHEESSWARAHFDHERTRFALRDRHAQLPCASCHAGEHYRDTPLTCTGCHAPDDVHRGSRGEKCGDCHVTSGWKTAKFDHARETGFALLGRHARIACGDCHRSGNLKDPLPKECHGCHRSDDRHAGRFGTDCASCHGNDSWHIANYDHAARHHFALTGPHASLDCHACHTAAVKTQKLGTDCASCHRADDVHGGALGASCERCHDGTHWNENVRFDHDLTAFPLVGLHVVVICAQCHASQRFKDAPTGCVGCHTRNDVHKGALGRDCAACHSPNGWKLWDFDHGAKTRFPLTGAHRSLRCADCHIRPASEVKLSGDCVSCHASDDVHTGQFGRQCERCHSTLTFKGGSAR